MCNFNWMFERKEYDELNFSEIAFQLGYSSVAHLSAQFKKTTGLTPAILKKWVVNVNH